MAEVMLWTYRRCHAAGHPNVRLIGDSIIESLYLLFSLSFQEVHLDDQVHFVQSVSSYTAPKHQAVGGLCSCHTRLVDPEWKTLKPCSWKL